MSGTRGGPVVAGVTVDDRATRVREDGFRVARTPSGWTVDGAVALVAAAIPTGTREDAASRRVAWGRPRELEAMAPSLSLDPGAGRAAMVTTVDLDAGLEVVGTRMRVASFASRAALDPGASDEALRDGGHALHVEVADAFELARGLAARPDGPTFGRFAGQGTVATLNRLAGTAVARGFALAGHPLLFSGGGRNGEHAWLSSRPEPVAAAWGNPYAMITSPVRRYADLVNQRIAVGALEGRAPLHEVGELDALVDELNRRRAARGGRRGPVDPRSPTREG